MPHLCHAIGCLTPVPPAMFMCRRHWYMVPRELRAKVWANYRPGQENDKNPTAEYLRVTAEAKLAVKAKEDEAKQ